MRRNGKKKGEKGGLLEEVMLSWDVRKEYTTGALNKSPRNERRKKLDRRADFLPKYEKTRSFPLPQKALLRTLA